MGLVTTTVTREATKLIEPRRSMAKADELVLRRTLSHAPTRGIGGLCVGPGALPSCSACVGPVVRAEHDAKAECAMEVEDIIYAGELLGARGTSAHDIAACELDASPARDARDARC